MTLAFDHQTYKIYDYGYLQYRAFENLNYCEHPVDDIQKCNIFVPEPYYHNQTINGYDLRSAPIFMPNTVGGYLPGPADCPGLDRYGHDNIIVKALHHGYVVVSAGVRGRTSGKVSTEFFEGSKESYIGKETGKLTGKAPAFIVDMKAVIRFLRFNKDVIPGNVERIITSGTSAGGALSALTGTSGNQEEYLPYLEEIGACDQRDDVFACNCFCPIHNLEHADMAYEWQFYQQSHFYRTKHKKTEHGIERVPFDGEMTDKQMQLANELKDLFPEYVHSLNLGFDLKEFIKTKIMQSAQNEMDTHHSKKYLSYIMAANSEIEKMNCFEVKNNQIVSMDWDAYIATITRMKATPAFDALDCKSPENDEFNEKHFTEFSYSHSEVNGQMADETIIKMMNPVSYVGNKDCAKYFRIRHGSFDRDTSFAIPSILALLLEKNGIDVDFRLPWGLVHSGDYDTDELFAWIDRIVEES